MKLRNDPRFANKCLWQGIVEKEGFYQIPEEYQRYNDDVLGRKWEVREPEAMKKTPIEGPASN